MTRHIHRNPEIQSLYEEWGELEKRSVAKKNEWIHTQEAFKSECSHRFSDGTSAWEDGYILSECKICGLNDL